MNLLESPIWKKIFLIISILLLLIMPAISHDFGQNGDEDVEAQYGRDIFNYYANGDQQALDYDIHIQPKYKENINGMQFYGGMFDLMTEAAHRAIPTWKIMDVRHFFSSILGALLMIFTGLLAFRLSKKKWWVAVLALLFIAFSPRIFGESMNNGKDIPFALGMVIAIYYFICIMDDLFKSLTSWKMTIGLMVGFFVTFGMRPAGGLLLLAYLGLFFLVFVFTNKELKAILWKDKFKLLKKVLLKIILAFIVGYALALFTWPYGLESPIGHLFTSLAEMSNRSVIIRVLYDGFNYPSNQTPWQYNFKWIMISSPIVIIISSFLFLFLIPKIIKEYGFATIFILLFSVLFPLLYIIYKHSTNFDAWRHVFFVYPFLGNYGGIGN